MVRAVLPLGLSLLLSCVPAARPAPQPERLTPLELMSRELAARCALPRESEEFAASVVDAEAATTLGMVLKNQYVRDRAAFSRAIERFYEGREDDYDFLFAYAPDIGADAVGIHIEVGKRYAPTLYRNNDGLQPLSAEHPRLRSVLVMTLPDSWGGGPILHELGHYWMNGLGLVRKTGFPEDPHWGMTGVGGILGGFDSAKLTCAEPADARPPDCARREDGRYEVLVPGRKVGGDYGVYAPLELYLMGLIPASEVPPVAILEDPQVMNGGDEQRRLHSVSGVRWVTAEEISGLMGGPPPERVDADRPLRVGFVYYSPTPHPEGLAQIATAARQFGAIEAAAHSSWCHATGGRSKVRVDL